MPHTLPHHPAKTPANAEDRVWIESAIVMVGMQDCIRLRHRG